MKTSWVVGILVLLIIIIGGWYWYAYPQQSATVPSTDELGTTEETQTDLTPLLSTASSAVLGNFLTASSGMTLYEYTKDTAGVSNCSGTCAENWPPYLVSISKPLLSSAGLTGTLAAIARADGTTQLTYNGKPLYFWKGDAKPGDATGQNVGGVWFVVKP